MPVLREGSRVDQPALPAVPPEPGNALRVSRDPVSDEVEIVVTGQVPEQVSPGGHRYRLTSELRARVGPAAPEAAQAGGTQVGEVRLTSGDVVTAAATVRARGPQGGPGPRYARTALSSSPGPGKLSWCPSARLSGAASDRHTALPAMRGRDLPPRPCSGVDRGTPGAPRP